MRQSKKDVLFVIDRSIVTRKLMPLLISRFSSKYSNQYTIMVQSEKEAIANYGRYDVALVSPFCRVKSGEVIPLHIIVSLNETMLMHFVEDIIMDTSK